MGDRGEQVGFLLGANPGEPSCRSEVASGGELGPAMLARGSVLTDAPPTLVFDEVDAGVGGEAALAVGRALAELAAEHQVLVVTHLAQVAAFADHQVVVPKAESPRAGPWPSARASTARTGSSSWPACSRASPTRRRPRRHAEELLGARPGRERVLIAVRRSAPVRAVEACHVADDGGAP